LCATVGVESLRHGGYVSRAEQLVTWRAWWLGDLIGALVVAPVVMTWTNPRDHAGTPRRARELVALVISTAVTSFVTFIGWPGVEVGALHMAYVAFPFVVWAALRFGPRGGITTTLMICAVAVVGAVLRRGPFLAPSVHESLVTLQAYVTLLSVTALFIGA